jgi:eukaryotic-like serine/threonine-protein kinase
MPDRPDLPTAALPHRSGTPTESPRRTAIPEAAPPSVGPYDLLAKVGEGSMGTVYRGRHRDTGAIVAVKVMNASLPSNPVLLKRFEQEFRAASRLDHPNIVRALDYGDSGTSPYLVMEFVEGESLGQKLERDGPMAEADAVRLIAQVARGLRRAHKEGLIHRDVKPDNILITPDGTAKLADLGLAREIGTDLNLTKMGRGLGTPHYMAPEQFRDAKNADARCDLYSLAATLYVVLTGQLPFPGKSLQAWLNKVKNQFTPPRALVPGLSRHTDRAIRRALNADPRLRPATCREFIEDLTGRCSRRAGPDPAQTAEDLWYVAYVDPSRNLVTGQATTAGIRRALRKNALGDPNDVRVSRSRTGPFVTLLALPEFRDLVLAPRVRRKDGD